MHTRAHPPHTHIHTLFNYDREVMNNFVGGKKYALMFKDESESLKKERLKMWYDSENHLMLNLCRIIVY